MIKVLKVVCSIGLILAVYLYTGVDLLTVAKLAVCCFWLVLLPGTLIVAALLDKNIRSLETWLVGAAIGINILPVLFTIGGLFTASAAPVWWVVSVLISLGNVFGIIRYAKGGSTPAPSIRIPLFPILLLSFCFFGTVLFYHFGRHPSQGVYSFTTYFGGDMGYHAGYVECFERYTSLHDWHDGGARMYYHDFTHRMIAGLHFFSGGNIYDAYWYFLTSFDTLLLLLWIWVIAKKLTGENLVAWIATMGFFFYPGKDAALYMFDSSSFRLGIVEAFAALYFISEFTSIWLLRGDRLTDDAALSEKHVRWASVLFVMVCSLFVCWKITDYVILVPALLIVGLLQGIRERSWRLFALVSCAAFIGGVYVAIAYAPANAIAGEDIVGRHLWPLCRALHNHLGFNLHPVMPLSHLNTVGVIEFTLLLLPFLVWNGLFSGRYIMSLLILPRIPNRRYAFPQFTALIVSTVLIGYFFANFISKAHYHYGDVYQSLFADSIGLLSLGIVLASAWKIARTQSIKSRKEKYFLAAVLFALLIEGINSFSSYKQLFLPPKYDLPIALIDALDSASTHLPPDALVATHRFNLDANTANLNLSRTHRRNDEDWNFEFYAAGLKAPVIMEGPADGLISSVSTLAPDPDYCAGPNLALASDFWKKSALLDTLFTSSSAERAIAAMDSLHATHVLIDHTVGQHLAEGVAAVCDTAYNSPSITLLRRKK